MPEHTSFITYLLAMFPALRENAHNLGGTFPPPSQHVEYRGLEPIFASMLVIAFVVFLAAGVRGELRKLKQSVVPDDTLTTRTFFEAFVGYFYDMAKDVMGPRNAKRYFPIIGGAALFIFFSNCLALIPGFNPPTANLNVTFACAFTVFLAFNYWGIKENGWGYIAHLAGPKWYLAPLIFPIEVISTCVRPVTLAVRLMMNMAVDHLVVAIALGLVAFLVPVPLMFLGIIVVLVQTLVFSLLTSIYIGLATEHAEEH
ncbi:ATP synthase F0 sector subunit a [Minicystis rosea]|nr:ATP synthase F0 sector subunit a [Minicystis rosea]